jgi:hypothetical protein
MLNLRCGDHAACTYTDPADQLTVTAALADSALAAGAQAVVFPPPDAIDWFGTSLNRPERDTGQLRILDSREVLRADGPFDPDALHRTYTEAAHGALAAGYSGLWVSVDMCWAIDVDPDALTAFEAYAHPLFADGNLTAMCHYDELRFGAKRTGRACAAHPVPPGDTRFDCHRYGRTVALSGETDLSNTDAFRAIVADMTDGERIDLTGMKFLDVDALRGLAQLIVWHPRVTVIANEFVTGLVELLAEYE